MNVILRCVECGKVTTPLEAWLRRFREGLCGNCGGAFKVDYVETRPRPESAVETFS